MLGADVIVRAIGAGRTIREREKESKNESYLFEEGDRGILRWKRECNPALWQPTVIWDRDEERKARITLATDLEVIGIEVQGNRFCCS